MPTFTLKLGDLVESEFDLGLTPLDYPIFQETYRQPLNQKIIRHYWNYEIGQETESMFRFALNRKMNEIMPFYNQLYTSQLIQFPPLQTMNYTDFVTRTYTGSDNVTSSNNNSVNTNESEDTTSSTTTGVTSRTVSSDTPQTMLAANEDYASSAADANSQTTGSGTNNSTTTTGVTGQDAGTIDTARSHTETVERTLNGTNGLSSAELLNLYRSTFLNIDMEIIDDLRTLFMQVWDNGDEFNRHNGLEYGYGFAPYNGWVF